MITSRQLQQAATWNRQVLIDCAHTEALQHQHPDHFLADRGFVLARNNQHPGRVSLRVASFTVDIGSLEAQRLSEAEALTRAHIPTSFSFFDGGERQEYFPSAHIYCTQVDLERRRMTFEVRECWHGH